MSRATTELVERLYRRLLQAAREREGGIAGPLTVADLYQHLIPYRGVRGDLGVLELAQYEHALLRLLAGEGGFLRLLDEEAQRDVAAELRATNPILGIYRDYAAAGVELKGSAEANGREAAQGTDEPPPLRTAGEEHLARQVREVAELISEEAEEDENAWNLVSPPLPEIQYAPPRPAAADATRVVHAAAVPQNPPAPPPPPPAPPPGSSAATAGAMAPAPTPPAPVPSITDSPAVADVARGAEVRCVACAQPLPDVSGLRFCPNCGTDQVAVPCARCGTPIRGTWNFCIRCGARRPSPASSA